jgi:hypothetical protein
MTVQSLQQTMTSDDRAKFERGCELLLYMQAGKAFDDYWVPIGDGLLAVRRTVMTALSLSKARGGYYNEAFGKLCAKTPYADMHKVERSNLLYCMEHLPDILEMRAGWTPTERAKINHPTSMAQKLREFLNRAPTEAPRRNASPMALLKDKNEQLQRTNLDLAERLASAEARDTAGSLFDLARDNVDDIARVIVSTVGVNKARSLHHSLGQAIASTPKPPKPKRPAG